MSGNTDTITVYLDETPIEVTITMIDGAVENGLPTGGTIGQVLSKKSSTDYDTEWVAQTGGGGGTWGSITGTLSDQTDLQDALNAKADTGHTHTGLVTNGDAHDHNGGDGGQISYSTLSNIPSTFTPSSHEHAWTDLTSGTPNYIPMDITPTAIPTTGKLVPFRDVLTHR